MLIFVCDKTLTAQVKNMNICIFGAASNKIDKIYLDTAEELSEKLAKRGHVLVFGAGTYGVMGACARGFDKVGGTLIGVIPKFFDDFDMEVKYKKCTDIIYTETMDERKEKMIDLADAFIIAPGGIGTYEEFFEVITLKQLGRHAKPIVIYNANGYYDKLEALMEHAIDEGFLNKECREIYIVSDDIDEVIEYIENDHETLYTIYDLKK